MRTTVNLDEDVLRAAKSIAAEQGRSLGQVLSDLARRGLRPRDPGSRGILPIFEIEPGVAALTPEMVREALDDGG